MDYWNYPDATNKEVETPARAPQPRPETTRTSGTSTGAVGTTYDSSSILDFGTNDNEKYTGGYQGECDEEIEGWCEDEE